jgi:hypothetical protein
MRSWYLPIGPLLRSTDLYAEVNSRITKKKARSPTDWPGPGDGGTAFTCTQIADRGLGQAATGQPVALRSNSALGSAGARSQGETAAALIGRKVTGFYWISLFQKMFKAVLKWAREFRLVETGFLGGWAKCQARRRQASRAIEFPSEGTCLSTQRDTEVLALETIFTQHALLFLQNSGS